MKNIVVLNCSHKKSSNTLDITMDVLGDISYDLVDIKDLNIEYCLACGFCKENDNCMISDDMEMIYHKLYNADVIILSSPIYFNNVTSRLKTLIDRMEVFFNRKVIRKEQMKLKEGYLISTSGAILKEGTKLGTEKTVDLFLKSVNSKLDEFLCVEGTDFCEIGELKERYFIEINELKNRINK